MPIGLLALDSEGKIASFNETAELILQLSSRDILGEKAEEVLPGDLKDLIREIGDQKDIIEKEIECSLKNGQSIPLEITMSSLEGDNNNPVGYIVLFRDLTEVQELKKEIERTQRQASLGRLAAGVAHEIRNPLSSIKGFATYFMERYKDVPEDHSTAGIMVQEVERLNRVVGQLLEFARPMTIQKKMIAVRPIIQHSLKMIERQAHEKNIIIRQDISPNLNEVFLDPDRINQVLLNLYLNSIEAMEGGGTLSVKIATANGKLKIVVSDTGIGMSSNDLENIFDPYFTTKSTGTGLGLAIVHNIIEAHKGETRVDSNPGKGTTVKILLPQSK
jgi:two-component system sensor histidine kinase HydH